MEVFNKLYSQVSSSVSSTVSQLSGVLPGNPVTREFDATTHIASAGPGTDCLCSSKSVFNL
jgi:SCY1-like protein 2